MALLAAILSRMRSPVAYEDLVDLNQAFRGWDAELSRQISQRLGEAGVPSGSLRVYHPGAATDERQIYAPDPNAPRKRPPEVPFGAATVATIQT
ncbi:MAG: hypothetical protein MUD07_09850 [Burkholderiaceae bacterium]|nr:hypothetical protein [Burkholderiaceae bacterium]